MFTMKKFSTTIKKNLADLYDYKFTDNMRFIDHADKFKVFRVLDKDGKVLEKKHETMNKEDALKVFQTMVLMRNYDFRYNMAQREGKISFYMTATGEEGAVIGSVAGLNFEDTIYPQYREGGALIYRGFTLQEMTDQLTGNEADIGKGRQMPIHFVSKKLNYQCVKSPLGTQLPQASGAGYLYRTQGIDKICLTYFAEGSASEGDFHPALNFAATLNCQTLFFCRNNSYAISTPADEQYSGDGIAIKGLAYGINSIRIDGNDPLAVYNAVKYAREYILREKKPALIEAMTYRVGDHSTSDYSKAYRTDEEMKKWNEYISKIGDPISRFYNYLENKGWMNKTEYDRLTEDSKQQARTSLKNSMNKLKPSIDSMFEDVYEELPQNLIDQKRECKEHIAKYPKIYNTDNYAS